MFESDETDPVEEADGQIEITSAVATVVNEIVVTLAHAVDIDDTDVTLTKGTSTIPATIDWDDDYAAVTITTASKLTNGTYTVTLTSEEDEDNTDSADVEVTDQDVAEIVITTDVALTAPAPDKDTAYASYDVFDQYGNSIRASATITWAGSCKITGDKTTGKLTLEKTTEGDEWVYGEKIYVTGVYAKTGASVNKTLEVGTEQALDSLEIAGFVKEGTSTIIQTLPADFKDGTYYLLFKPLDQAGTQLDVDDLQGNDVTFVSDNVLVIKSVSADIEEKTIAGETYAAALVSPGIRVSDGGEVTITAIANRTGNKTEISMVVGEDQVLVSFKLLAPASVVADGDTNVEIPFEALDVDGNEITNFVTLAKQTTFNTLTFSASDNSTLKLAEQADGSAKLLWSDRAIDWDETVTTDGIDRPISLTAVVVGGGTDNEMIYVSDMRRPDGILSVDMDEVYTEGATITFYASDAETEVAERIDDMYESFQFVDQYGKTIKGTKGTAKKFGDSTGFLAAANDGTLLSSNIEINGYTYGIRVKYAGSGRIAYDADDGDKVYLNADEDDLDNDQAVITGTGAISFETSSLVTSAATGEGFKFEIAKIKLDETAQAATKNAAANWESATPAKYVGTAVVDLSQIKSFAIGSLNKFYVGAITTDTGAATGAGKIAADSLIDVHSDNGATVIAAENGLTDTAKYQKAVKVTGTYNGKSVTIPTNYYTVEGSKISTSNTAGAVLLGENTIDKIVTDGLNIQDLYDKTTSQGVSKDASDTLKVTLYNINDENFNGTLDTPIAAAAINTAKIEATQEAILGALNNTEDLDGDEAIAAALIDNPAEGIDAGTTAWAARAELIAANNTLKALASALASVPEESIGDEADADHISEERLASAIELVNEALNDVDVLLLEAGVYAPVYDTVSTTVAISDQAPTATTISGLAESCTLSPDTTLLEIDEDTTGIRAVSTTPITVKDQYGETIADATITYRATNVKQNEDGYAENNFAVSGNDTDSLTIVGAERGDAFDLVLTSGSATATCIVTVGADDQANITGSVNNYLGTLIGNGEDGALEQQRVAGLG